MKRNVFHLVCLMLWLNVVVPLQGQDVDAEETRIFELKNASAFDLQSILSIFRATIKVPDASRGRILTVVAPKELMPAIEETIKKFDVPPPPSKTVEMSIHILGALDTPVGNAACPGCALPPDLQSVATQLQKTFSYKGYKLLDTQLTRQIDNSSLSIVGSLPNVGDPLATYRLFVDHVDVKMAANNRLVLSLRGMRFSVSATLKSEGSTMSGVPFGIETSLEIPLGQRTVIGKTTVGATAIILVVDAKIAD